MEVNKAEDKLFSFCMITSLKKATTQFKSTEMFSSQLSRYKIKIQKLVPFLYLHTHLSTSIYTYQVPYTVCVFGWAGSIVSHSVVSDSLQPCGLQPPGSSVHGILQARILELVAIFFSRGSSQPRSPALKTDSLLSEPPRTKCYQLIN